MALINNPQWSCLLALSMFKSKLAGPLALPVYKAMAQTVTVVVLKQNANHILELE